jgi:hypothetical protein
MQTKATIEACELLKEALKELESQKGSVLAGVQKLLRASKIIGNEDCAIWCEIQLGNPNYTTFLENYLDSLIATNKNKTKANLKKLEESIEKLSQLGLKKDIHYNLEELNVKANESGGGYINIGFIEEKYNDLVRTKRGNDGTYYKNNLNNHLNYVGKEAHTKATNLYNSIAYAELPQTSFDILKQAIDDKLLDINPELGEKLMQAFKSVSSNNSEEWSHALTTCRRFIESMADELFPAREEQHNGRSLGQSQYINRLWAFFDQAISSETNRELAKSHVDFVGSYLQRLHKLTNKGVHAELTRIEAVKAVFHTYLICANILEYLGDLNKMRPDKLNIHTASLDELESVLDVSRNIAKTIVKLRVEKGRLNPEDISAINGIGTKTMKKILDVVRFEKRC